MEIIIDIHIRDLYESLQWLKYLTVKGCKCIIKGSVKNFVVKVEEIYFILPHTIADKKHRIVDFLVFDIIRM